MKKSLPYILIMLSTQLAFSQWQQQGDGDRGRMQYYNVDGNLGFSIRTNTGGGWAWQFVDVANNSYFHVQYPTGNVGIGTTSPSEKLDIRGTGSVGVQIVTDGSSTSRPVLGFFRGSGFWHIGMNMDQDNSDDFHFRYNGTSYPLTITSNSGYVGIGTTKPDYKLQVVGGAIALDEDQPLRGGGRWLISGNSSWVQVGTSNPGINLRFDAGGPSRMFINGATGNVGIGTSSPTEKLTVNGTIYGTEVKVDLSVPGPDYVFNNDYELPSLEDVKAHIEQFNRLPEVPSAEEMAAKGIHLGEMNMLLLKKIEELTLYVIKLQSENERQDQLIQELQNK